MKELTKKEINKRIHSLKKRLKNEDDRELNTNELAIVTALLENRFIKEGANNTCKKLAEQEGVTLTWDSIKRVRSHMIKYGFFKYHFPDYFQTVYKSFGTRLSLENIDLLKKKSKEINKSIQDVVNQSITEYCTK